MRFVKYVQSLAWFLSHSWWDEFFCFVVCLWLLCVGRPRFTPQLIQALRMEAPISVSVVTRGGLIAHSGTLCLEDGMSSQRAQKYNCHPLPRLYRGARLCVTADPAWCLLRCCAE